MGAPALNCLDADSVQLPGADVQAGHRLAEMCWTRRGAGMSSAERDAGDLAFLFNRAQLEAVFGLGLFDAQVWKECAQAYRGAAIRDLPDVHRSTADGRCALHSPCAAERGVQQTDSLRLDLLYADTLAESRLLGISYDAHLVGAAFYTDRSIGIDDAGKVSQVGLEHRILVVLVC